MICRHCWIAGERSRSEWCHLCGQQRAKVDVEDAAIARLRMALANQRHRVNAIAGESGPQRSITPGPQRGVS